MTKLLSVNEQLTQKTKTSSDLVALQQKKEANRIEMMSSQVEELEVENLALEKKIVELQALGKV